MKNKDVEFWLDPVLTEGTVHYNGKYYKDLVGYIQYINIDINLQYKIMFITETSEKDYKYEIKISKHPEHDDCYYFRIYGILNILKEYNIQDQNFSIKINIEGKYLENKEKINILYRP